MLEIYRKTQKQIENSNVDIYLVNDTSHFKDDVEVNCHKCNKKCYARPYYPRNKKILCINCFSKHMK